MKKMSLSLLIVTLAIPNSINAKIKKEDIAVGACVVGAVALAGGLIYASMPTTEEKFNNLVKNSYENIYNASEIQRILSLSGNRAYQYYNYSEKQLQNLVISIIYNFDSVEKFRYQIKTCINALKKNIKELNKDCYKEIDHRINICALIQECESHIKELELWQLILQHNDGYINSYNEATAIATKYQRELSYYNNFEYMLGAALSQAMMSGTYPINIVNYVSNLRSDYQRTLSIKNNIHYTYENLNQQLNALAYKINDLLNLVCNSAQFRAAKMALEEQHRLDKERLKINRERQELNNQRDSQNTNIYVRFN